MDITLRDAGVLLAPDARLTAVAAPILRDAVEDHIALGRTLVVIDLSGVVFMDSSGLGALVGGLKAARHAGGDLRIAGAPEQVRQVLRLTNLDRILPVYADVDAAFDA